MYNQQASQSLLQLDRGPAESSPLYHQALSQTLAPLVNQNHAPHTSSTSYGFPNVSTPDNFQNISSSSRQNSSVEAFDLRTLMGNPQVRNLFNQANESQQRLGQQTEIHSQLLQQVGYLQNEVHDLKQRFLALQNQSMPMISNTNNVPVTTSAAHVGASTQPMTDAFRTSIWPPQYPEKIVWVLEDCSKFGLVTDANPSRPNMAKCIRDQSGNVIGKSAYTTIKKTARLLISTKLKGLPIPEDPEAKYMKQTKTYYTKFFPQEYRQVLLELENSEPLLKLCAPHWKADHILIQSLKGKKGSNKRKQSGGSEENNDDTDEHDDSDTRPSSRQNLSSTPQASLSEQLSTLGTPVQINVGPTVHETSAGTNGTRAAFTTTPSAAPVVPSQPHVVDVSFIEVDPSVAILRTELKELIPSVDCVSDLLDAMEKSPNHFSGQPSQSLRDLLTAVEGADPNTPEISEDETNQSWGHRQLSGAWRQVLTSWDSIGTSDIACRLLAAVVKTCKVARLLCSERGVQPSSYLCDAYLQEIVEKLWDCWKAAGGPLVKGKAPAHSAPNTSNPATADSIGNDENTEESNSQDPEGRTIPQPSDAHTKIEVEKILSGLLIEDLKVWTTKFDISLEPQKKKHSKDEYKKAILASPLSTSESGYAELQALMQTRKAAKIQKKKTLE